MLVYNFLFFVYYFFALDTPVIKYQFRFVAKLIFVLANFSIIYYIFRKASKGLKDQQKNDHNTRMRFLNITMYINISINLILMIILEVQLFHLEDQFDEIKMDAEQIKEYERTVCSQPIWLSNSVLFFAQVLILYFYVRKIDRQT